MAVTVLISVLALVQLIVFGMLVGRARHRYGVQAPAVSGHPTFERYFRVQMNTLELLVVFLPALWLATLYVSVLWTTILGALYLVGRTLYCIGYVSDPKKRGAGYGLSMLPTLILIVIALVGCLRALARG